MTFTFTAVVKATAAKFNFAACSRHAKCSFRVRLHTKYILLLIKNKHTLAFFGKHLFCLDVKSIKFVVIVTQSVIVKVYKSKLITTKLPRELLINHHLTFRIYQDPNKSALIGDRIYVLK
jgi:hypothetical protein